MLSLTIATVFSLNFLLFACSDKDSVAMNGETKSSNADAPGPAEPGSTGPNSAEPSSAEPSLGYRGTSTLDIDELQAEALMPVPVSGAYLVCTPIPRGAKCRAFDYQNRPYDMLADRAFILTGNPVSWTRIDFLRVGVGTWIVNVPATEKSYGVAFLDANDQHLADWIMIADSNPENLALDGSFESLDVGGEDYLPVLPSADYPWKVFKSSSPIFINRCSVAMLEIQTTLSGQPPIDGKQWIELNSDCLDPDVGHPETFNVTVSQKIKVEPGHSYLVMFNHRSRAEGDFEISFAGSSLATVHSADPSWRELRFLKKVDSAEVEISLTGMNNSGGGGGTLIDNVRIYDLGAGPLK